MSHFLSIIAPQTERVGEGRKKDNRNLSTVSSHPEQSGSPPGSCSFLSCSPARSYLQGRGVRSILPEAGPRSPRKAQPEALWGQEHTALPDPVLHMALLMVVLHMEPKGDVHRGCCLRTEPLVVAVLLDNPVKRKFYYMRFPHMYSVANAINENLHGQMQSSKPDCPFLVLQIHLRYLYYFLLSQYVWRIFIFLKPEAFR